MNAIAMLRELWEKLNKIRATQGPNSQEFKDTLKEYRKLKRNIISPGDLTNGGTHTGEELYPDLPPDEKAV